MKAKMNINLVVSLSVGWSTSNGKYIRWCWIPLTVLTPSFFVSVPAQEFVFQRHMSWSFYVQWVKLRDDCSFCWYCRNNWPSLFKLSFHNLIIAPAYFGYSVRVVCLETDGTFIEDDETLVSMSTQTMMILGKDHIWTATSDDIPPLQNIEQPEVERLR